MFLYYINVTQKRLKLYINKKGAIMKPYRLKFKIGYQALLNVKSILRVATLTSIFLVPPVILADTATGIITKIKGDVHLSNSVNHAFTGIKVLDKSELLRKKFPPLTPKMIRERDLSHQKLPIAPAIMKNILPGNRQQCAPIAFSHDLDGDNVNESYNMVSLLDCNNRNYVTPIRLQQGGTCAAYSATTMIESYLGILLDLYRPITPDHPETDFLPINLSEGYGDNIPQTPGVWSGDAQTGLHNWYGLTLDTYYPNAEYFAYWEDNGTYTAFQDKLDALEFRYPSIPECNNIISGNDIRSCLLAAAEANNMLFVNIDSNGTSQLKGNNYQSVDNDIKSHLQQGYVVQTSVNWASHQLNPPNNFPRYGGVVADVPFNHNTYALRVNRVNTTNAIPNRIASREHSVAIIGYLEGLGNTQIDYWIIKNSWGNPGATHVFDLIQIPSTAGPVTNINSTKRIFGTNGYGVIQGLRFHKFQNNINNPVDINYTDTVQLNDHDSDGIIDFFDNCPLDKNPKQEDSDGDHVGDKCDNCPDTFDLYQPLAANPLLPGNDIDNDGKANHCDNCPNDANPNQTNIDGDNKGDACDLDDDNDFTFDSSDNCPLDYNRDQNDSDGDNIGDICDNCPSIANENQQDSDYDAIGDTCDNCPNKPNRTQQDSDNDGFGDACDNCPETYNPNGQDAYKTVTSCGRSVRVPQDCHTIVERLYGSLCDFMKGVELSELRLRELNVHIIKDIDPAGPPVGPKPWEMITNIDIIKNEQVVFKGVNEAVIKEGMKELGIRPVFLKNFKEKVLEGIKK